MKKLFVFICLAAIIGAVSCSGGRGGDDNTPSPPPTSNPPPPPTPTYMNVKGTYSLATAEIENTCSCDGPRNLPSPQNYTFDQNFDASGHPTGQVFFSGGGIHFGGTNGADDLDTSGNMTVVNFPYDSVTTINYTGVFTGANGVATSHQTITPIHLRLDYATGQCCNGNAGYNIITLDGPKTAGTTTVGSESKSTSFLAN